MSETRITIEEITEVQHHPDADRLDIVQVLGYQVIVGRDQFKVGDHVVYLPVDIMVPEHVSEELGIQKYLRHGEWDGEKVQCRVSACRLRGLPSYGICLPLSVWKPEDAYTLGFDLTDHFEGRKYVPPVRLGGGDQLADEPRFHQYTGIENMGRCPDLIPDGTQVVVSEKLHGSNCRLGLCRNELGSREYMAGSHKVRRKSGAGLYWHFFSDTLKDMCLTLSSRNQEADVIVFGEIYGQGVQDMQYGLSDKAFRVFDISVNGQYMDHDEMSLACEFHGIQTVPVLFKGPFTKRRILKLTDGPTTLGSNGKFKGREGVVIKPVVEQVVLGKRMILKSVSVDYLSRRGAEDNE